MHKKRIVLNGKRTAAIALACVMTVGNGGTVMASAENAEGDYLIYTSDFNSKEEAYQAAYELNQEIAEEGIVLLKNDNDTLPLSNEAKNVTVFQRGLYDIIFSDGLTGMIGGNITGFMGRTAAGMNVFDAMREAGYNVNPEVEAFDHDPERSPLSTQEPEAGAGKVVYETAIENYDDAVWESCKEYNDAAIVVLTRESGEEDDAPLYSAEKLPASEQNSAEIGAEETQWLDENGNPIQKLDQAAHIDDSYLQLTKYEADLLVEAGKRFDKVVVVFNSTNLIQPDFLVNNEEGVCDLSYYTGVEGSTVKIDSALWVNGMGYDGVKALGKILSGEISPSGHTADIWSKDFRKDPSAINLGYYGMTDGNRLNYGVDENGTPVYTADGYVNAPEINQMSYSEGIYNGYRFYETAAYEINQSNYSPVKENGEAYTDGEEWYSDNVVYPFGHGLSYTEFSWEVVGQELSGLNDATGNGEITVDVKVTNTGDAAAKEVVQLYYSAPYIEGGVEKSHTVLGAFAKTDTLEPGDSQTLTLSMRNYDVASYNMDVTYGEDDTVSFGENSGYKLDAGDYYFALCTDSHNVKAAEGTTSILDIRDSESAFVLKATLDEEVAIKNDPDTGEEVSNLFEDETAGSVLYGNNNNVTDGTIPVLSRADFEGTMPVKVTQNALTRSTEYMDELYRTQNYATGLEELGTKTTTINSPLEDAEGLATSGDWTASEWFKNRAVSGYSELDENGNRVIVRSADENRIGKTIVDGEAGEGEVSKILLYELTKYDYDSEIWDQFLDQLTIDEMMNFVTYGGFGIWGVDELGIPQSRTPDGPEALCFDPGEIMGYAYQSLVACTFNEDLAYRMGKSFGEEALWATPIDREVDSGVLRGPISGWYAPGANLHRSKFGGRNYGYYSEDVTLTKVLLTQECQGAREKGLITFLKHFALNDQETDRTTGNGIVTWANEQTMREIYFKAAEDALKGPSLGYMSGYNRIGNYWTGNHYALNQELVRGEWQFEGTVVTDAYRETMDIDRMIRSGNELALAGNLFNFAGVSDVPTRPGDTYLIEQMDENGKLVRDENGVIQTEEVVMDFDTQTAALRNACKYICYAVSQSNAMRNGASQEYMITEAQQLGTITVGTEGAEETVDVEYDAAFTDLYEHNTITYSLYAGELPQGLTLDEATGKITGTVGADVPSGEYTFEILGKVDKWAPKYKQCTITVVSPVAPIEKEEETEAEGDDFGFLFGDGAPEGGMDPQGPEAGSAEAGGPEAGSAEAGGPEAGGSEADAPEPESAE